MTTGERLKELRENGTGDGRDSSANFTTGRETGEILVHILPGGREKHGIPDTRDERLGLAISSSYIIENHNIDNNKLKAS